MTALTKLVRLGGIARISALRSAGASARDIQAAIDSGQLRRIRKGWVYTADVAPEIVRAVRLGGRLACISAAKHLGLWTPDGDRPLHLARPAHTGRTYGDATGVVEHWQSAPWRTRETAVESVDALVRQVLLCCEREDALVVIDSALNQRKLTVQRLAKILRSLPARFASVLGDVDSASESGLETMCRLRLRIFGCRIRSQVYFDGLGYVDLVIGDRLVIEADGREWHEGPTAFLADRTRDLTLTRLGYIVIRLAYHHVVNEWQLVHLAIAALISRGEHLWSDGHRGAGLAVN